DADGSGHPARRLARQGGLSMIRGTSWKAALGVTAGVCVLLPFIVPQYSLTILIEALIFGLFAMSLDLLVGYCRLYSFGHAAAYGLGAYSAAIILTQLQLPLPVGIVLAVL